MTEYVDSVGRVPRDATTVQSMDVMRQVLLTAIVLGHGGTLDVPGLGTPERVSLLLSYELKIGGRGDGTIRIEAIHKP
jgi:hypothetical protein